MPGVQVLAGGAAGNIWIGTSGAGISVLDHGGTLGDKGDDTWTTYAAGVALPSGCSRWRSTMGAAVGWLLRRRRQRPSDVQFSRALLPYVEKVGP